MKNFAVLLSLVMLAGCSKDARLEQRVVELEKGLGDYRWIGQPPDVIVKVLAIDISDPENKYSLARVKITGVLQQQGAFPLKKYHASVNVSLLVAGKNIGGTWLGGTVKDGQAAFSDDAILTDYPPGKKLEKGDVQLRANDFVWMPAPDLTGRAHLAGEGVISSAP